MELYEDAIKAIKRYMREIEGQLNNIIFERRERHYVGDINMRDAAIGIMTKEEEAFFAGVALSVQENRRAERTHQWNAVWEKLHINPKYRVFGSPDFQFRHDLDGKVYVVFANGIVPSDLILPPTPPMEPQHDHSKDVSCGPEPNKRKKRGCDGPGGIWCSCSTCYYGPSGKKRCKATRKKWDKAEIKYSISYR